MKIKSFYIKRNIHNSIIIVVILCITFILVISSLMMKKIADDYEDLILSNLDLNIIIHGNNTFGEYDDRSSFESESIAFSSLIDGLNDFDSILAIDQEYVTENEYIALVHEKDDRYEAVYLDAPDHTETLEASKRSDDGSSSSMKRHEHIISNFRGIDDDIIYYLDIHGDVNQRRLALYLAKLKTNIVNLANRYSYETEHSRNVPGRNTVANFIDLSIAGVNNDGISYISGTDIDIIEGRMFSKEDILSDAKYVIMPMNAFFIDDKGQRRVEVGDKIPFSIYDGKQIVHTEYYEVIGLHNGYAYQYADDQDNQVFIDHLYNTVYITKDNLDVMMQIVDGVRTKNDLPLKHSSRDAIIKIQGDPFKAPDVTYEYFDGYDEYKYDPKDDYYMSSTIIKLKNFDEYKDIILYLEKGLDKINTDFNYDERQMTSHDVYGKNDQIIMGAISYVKYHYDTNVTKYADIVSYLRSIDTVFSFISCLGIMAMIILPIIIILNEFKKRSQEIGIWQVLGRDKKDIYKSMFKDYLILSSIAYVISCIVTYGICYLYKMTLLEKIYVTNDDLRGLDVYFMADDNLIIYLIPYGIYIIIYMLIFNIVRHRGSISIKKRLIGG